MRVLVAGASGAIGRPLIAALHARGHAVAGLPDDPRQPYDPPHSDRLPDIVPSRAARRA